MAAGVRTILLAVVDKRTSYHFAVCVPSWPIFLMPGFESGHREAEYFDHEATMGFF